MMSASIRIVVAFPVLWFAGLPLPAGERVPWKQVMTVADGGDLYACEQAVLSLKKEREQAISRLIGVLRDEGMPMRARRAAAEMLGELRATEAVASLMSLLTNEMAVSEVLNEPCISTLFPCAGALVRIGKCASVEAREALASERDEHRRRLLCYIISRVETPEAGRLLIERDLESARSAEVKERLERALETAYFARE